LGLRFLFGCLGFYINWTKQMQNIDDSTARDVAFTFIIYTILENCKRS